MEGPTAASGQSANNAAQLPALGLTLPQLPFDFSAPPFRLSGRTPQDLLGLPDVELYGLRIPAAVLAGGLAVLLYYGWKAALMAALIWYAYRANMAGGTGVHAAVGQQQPRPQQAGSASSSRGAETAGADAATRRQYGAVSPQSSDGSSGGFGSSAQFGRVVDQPGQGSKSVFAGKGHKLGGS